MAWKPETNFAIQSTGAGSAHLVVRAAAMGMCFGVRDALARMRGMEDPQAVTVHGQLVHNEQVLADLEARGFRQVPENRRHGIPATPKVLITAHGVSDRERRRLAGHGAVLVDTTCPLVIHAHDAARRLEQDGRLVIVIGVPGHVEGQGIVGNLTRYLVVSGNDQVMEWGLPRLGVIAQTTTQPETAARLLELIRARNPKADIRTIDTICQPTKDRGTALEDLLERVDALVVVGGRNSNNTGQLARRARRRGRPSFHVQGPADLDADALGPYRILGLTAGTSTPNETIDAVDSALRSL